MSPTIRPRPIERPKMPDLHAACMVAYRLLIAAAAIKILIS